MPESEDLIIRKRLTNFTPDDVDGVAGPVRLVSPGGGR
jgi:hypothetical protein